MTRERLEQLERQRQDHVTRIFWTGLEIAGIFAVPLVVAIFFGLRAGGNALWFTLPTAFVFSWIVVIVRFRKVAKRMSALDEEVKQLRGELAEE